MTENKVKIFKRNLISSSLSAILFTLAVYSLICFGISIELFFLEADPTYTQNSFLLTLMISGAYGFLLNILIEEEDRNREIKKHLVLIFSFVTFAFILTLIIDPNPPRESLTYWAQWMIETFYIVLIPSFFLFLLLKYAISEKGSE